MRRFFALVLALTAAPMLAADADPAEAPAESKAAFEKISRQLDPGGDLMVVLNLDGLVEGGVNFLVDLVRLAPEDDPDVGEMRAALERLPAFLRRKGLFALDGFGLSVVPRADGLNDVKSFILRDPAAMNTALWRGMVGGEPRAGEALGYAPADSVWFQSSLGEPAQMWRLLGDLVEQVGGDEPAGAFGKWKQEVSANIGTNLDAVVDSLGAEWFVSVQLSPTRTLAIPLPGMDEEGAALSIPEPSVLMGVAVRDSLLHDTLLQAWKKAGLPMTEYTTNGAACQTLALPLPLPIPFSPTLAMHKRMLLVGSSSDAVRAALTAKEGGGGLQDAPGFKKVFAGQPLDRCNGIEFLDPRFSETWLNLYTAMLELGGEDSEPGTAVIKKIMQMQGSTLMATVTVNLPEGVLKRGVSSTSGRQVIMQAAVAPFAMLSAMAVPAFMEARSQASGNACINNLRQIDAAKEQWALAEGVSDGEVDEAGALEYIKGGEMPACPQGGIYTLNPLGTDPECSVHGSLQ